MLVPLRQTRGTLSARIVLTQTQKLRFLIRFATMFCRRDACILTLAFIHIRILLLFSSFPIEISVQFRRQILLTQTRIESPFARKSESRYRQRTPHDVNGTERQIGHFIQIN